MGNSHVAYGYELTIPPRDVNSTGHFLLLVQQAEDHENTKGSRSLEAYSIYQQAGIVTGWKRTVSIWCGNGISHLWRTGKTFPAIHRTETDFRRRERRVWMRGRGHQVINREVARTQPRQNPNIPKKRPGIKIASLNMRGRQRDGKDKMRMAIDWMRVNQIMILALQET